MKTPRPGELFADRYRIEEELGRGGSATVFRAWDENSRRPVALKILFSQSGGYSDEARARFDREVRIIANLQDPNTITLYGSGSGTDGLLYLVFEYIEGRDLDEVMRQSGPMPPARVVHILEQVLSSLREAHSMGLLHRDIKPTNIRVSDYMGDPDHVTVIDFGLAKQLEDASDRITREGVRVGTPQYMAPEQVLGTDLGPPTDIYSLGLVAYEMLTGTRLGDDDPSSGVFDRQLLHTGIHFPEGEFISPELAGVVERMTRRSPTERFQSVDEVLAALKSRPRALADPRPASRDGAAEANETFRNAIPPVVAFAIAGVFGAAVFGLGTCRLLDSDEDPPHAARPVPQPHGEDRSSEVAVVDDESLDVQLAVFIAGRRADVAISDARFASNRGCGKKHANTDHTFDFPFEGVTRHYNVFVPGGYDPNEPTPAIVLFHDMIRRPIQHPEREFLRQTNFREADLGEQVLLVSPYDPSGVPWADSDTQSRFVAAALDEVKERFCVDSSRIYAVGQGMGGNFAQTIACEHPFAALATNGTRETRADGSCARDRGIPHILFVGERDMVLPIAGATSSCLGRLVTPLARQEDLWRKFNACSSSKSVFREGNDFRCERWECEEPWVLCRHDYGHDWTNELPGFDLAVARRDCFGPTVGFPIEQVIWDFFREFRRDAP